MLSTGRWAYITEGWGCYEREFTVLLYSYFLRLLSHDLLEDPLKIVSWDAG